MRFTTAMKIGVVDMPDRIAVFDLETTGVDVESDRIVTAFIGLFDIATDQFVEKWSWVVDPGVPIPEAASNVHGYTNERIALLHNVSQPREAVLEIMQRLDTLSKASYVIAGMNLIYDFTLLDREQARHLPGMRPLMERNDEGRINTPVLFDIYLLDKAFDQYRKGKRTLSDIAPVYGVPVEANAHDAEADCLMSARIAAKLVTHSRLQGLSFQEIHNMLVPTHRKQSLGLADYWEKNLSREKTQEDRAKKIEAIKEVRAHAGHWPMKPRPTQEGTSA